MKKNLPIVYLDINKEDDGSGMEALSYVSRPATQIEWNKFSEQAPIKSLFTKKPMERIITGPIMFAETPIYRNSADIGEYYVKFSEESIKNMMIKLFKYNKHNNANEEHTSSRPVKSAVLIESYFISDRITSNLYPTLPKGSVIGSHYIEDEKYWNDVIMTDKFTGFSLEGYFIENYENDLINDIYSKIDVILSSGMPEDKKMFAIEEQLNKINLTK